MGIKQWRKPWSTNRRTLLTGHTFQCMNTWATERNLKASPLELDVPHCYQHKDDWVDGGWLEDFLSTVPLSHVLLVNLLVCLPPFGGDKIRFDEKGAALRSCSTSPGASTHLFSSVRTLSVVQLPCQHWSCWLPTPRDQCLCSHAMCVLPSSWKKW